MFKNKKLTGFYFFSVVFLVMINDCAGLIDGSAFLPRGEFYDFLFILLMLGWGWSCLRDRQYLYLSHFEKRILLPIGVLILYCSILGVTCILGGTQKAIPTVMVLRELFYVFVLLPYVSFEYDIKKMLRVFIIFDVLGSIVTIIEAFTGPLTSCHIYGFYEWATNGEIWRSLPQAPLLALFLCPYLILGIGQKKYVFTKWIDLLAISVMGIAKFINMSRMGMFALLVVCTIAFVICRGTSLKQVLRQFIVLIIAGIIGCCVLGAVFPEIFMRFVNGVRELLHLYGEDYVSQFNFSYRTGTMIDRWNYLKERDRLLFGLGPLHNDMKIYVGDLGGEPNTGVVAPDMGYGAILLRYGIVGMILFIGAFMWMLGTAIRERSIAIESLGLFLLGSLISGICLHGALGFYAFLVLGILMGLAFKEKRMLDYEEKSIN